MEPTKGSSALALNSIGPSTSNYQIDKSLTMNELQNA